MSQQVDAAIAARGLALCRTVNDPPIFHRVGPVFTTQPDAIVRVAPATLERIVSFNGITLR